MWMRRSPNDMLQRTSDASETSDRSYHTPGAFVRAISAKIASQAGGRTFRHCQLGSLVAAMSIFFTSSQV